MVSISGQPSVALKRNNWRAAGLPTCIIPCRSLIGRNAPH